MRHLGPNHADDCDGQTWEYSGEGYDRVRCCACGAEDHDPEEIPDFYKLAREAVEEMRKTPACEECGKSHQHLYATPTGYIHVECKK